MTDDNTERPSVYMVVRDNIPTIMMMMLMWIGSYKAIPITARARFCYYGSDYDFVSFSEQSVVGTRVYLVV